MEQIEQLAKELKTECKKTLCINCPFFNKSGYENCKISIEVDGRDYNPATWDI